MEYDEGKVYGHTFHPRYEAKTFNFIKKYVPKSARTLCGLRAEIVNKMSRLKKTALKRPKENK